MSIGILLITIAIGVSLSSKVKKGLAAVAATPADSFGEEQGGADYDFSDDFVSTTDDGLSSSEVGWQEPPAGRPAREKKDKRYEPVAVEETPDAHPVFDLRQAVVGQVILTNNYINEINQ